MITINIQVRNFKQIRKQFFLNNYCIEILKPLFPIDLPVFVYFVEREKVPEIVSQGWQQMAFNRSENGLKLSLKGKVSIES